MKSPIPMPPPPADRSPAAGGTVPVLDADVVALLDASLLPEPDDMPANDRLRRRVLRRIADAEIGRHLTVPADSGDWRDIAPGLALKVLHADQGLMSYLVRMAPGSTLPPHRHPVDEECVVLEGEVQIGALRLGPGGFHLGRKDLPHASIGSEGGALIFLRGAVPEVGQLI